MDIYIHYLICTIIYFLSIIVMIENVYNVYTYIILLFSLPFIDLLFKNTSQQIIHIIPTTDIRPRLYNEKITQILWDLTIHSITSMWENDIILTNNYNGSNIFSDSPHPPTLKLLYITQTAIWLYTLYTHTRESYPNKDYIQMYIHHVITLLLIMGSYYQGLFKIGVMVMFYHDFSDIFVDLLKLFNKIKIGYFLVEISFVLMVIVWIYDRLILYPLNIIIPSLQQSSHTDFCQDGNILERGGVVDLLLSGNKKCNIFRYGLLILYILDIKWLFLFLKIAYKLLFTKKDNNTISKEEYCN